MQRLIQLTDKPMKWFKLTLRYVDRFGLNHVIERTLQSNLTVEQIKQELGEKFEVKEILDLTL